MPEGKPGLRRPHGAEGLADGTRTPGASDADLAESGSYAVTLPRRGPKTQVDPRVNSATSARSSYLPAAARSRRGSPLPITARQLETAKAAQDGAAHDAAPRVRLVAGPGTGKSHAIGERVHHLLSSGIAPGDVVAVSFTRAAARDLALRITDYCAKKGCDHPSASDVRVSTLHSLALGILRKADLLAQYPAEPLVMDGWEVDHVYDAEFGEYAGKNKTRCGEIRAHHEAFWSTGDWGPPNYIPPDPAITDEERGQFSKFHGGRSAAYSCVLPGEIVRCCVEEAKAGTIDLLDLAGARHLIVDEFQDLNAMDLDLVDRLVEAGVVTFVAGDDDQSIYSFRFASPEGIQQFPDKHAACAKHILQDCFRCTPRILQAALPLVEAYAPEGRIPKKIASLYAEAAPVVEGRMHRWRFKSGAAEAREIAASCRSLVDAGVDPREIMILLSNTRQLEKIVTDALKDAEVEFEPPRSSGFLDSDVGRAVHALVRIACNRDDYVAHRVLLGVKRGVGVATCMKITDAVLANNLNFRDLFYQDAPEGVFKGRMKTAISELQRVCAAADSWEPTDELAQRSAAIKTLAARLRSEGEAAYWEQYAEGLPGQTNLGELRDFLWADNSAQQARVLAKVYERIGEPRPEEELLPPRVQVMTMHGAKGLSAQVVFVPGLEEAILPGEKRKAYPGLVREAARLLYVSVTRARAACCVSFAGTRMVFGEFAKTAPSQFCKRLGGAFEYRESGLTLGEVGEIVSEISNLF